MCGPSHIKYMFSETSCRLIMHTMNIILKSKGFLSNFNSFFYSFLYSAA